MKKFDLLNNFDLEILPEGWLPSDIIVFKKDICSCGRAYRGIGIRIKSHKGDGVLTLDDALKIRDFIDNHIGNITKN